MIEFNHLQKALADYAKAIRENYKESLDRDNRRATGQLITSVNTKIVNKGNKFEIDLNLEDYWKNIEYGTEPHWPQVNNILEWIEVKQILPYPDKNGNLPSEKQLAYLISRKISIEGTEGTHNLEDTIDTVDYESIIEDALDQDIMECIDEIIQIKL